MPGPLKVSTPIHLDVDPSKVFEFYPKAKKIDLPPQQVRGVPDDQLEKTIQEKNKKSLLFLDRKGILNSEKQRTKIFSQIAEEETNLAKRTLIELTSITLGDCSYTYKKGDQIVQKTIPLKENSAENAPDDFLTTVCKTEELSLRHFKQENFADALLGLLKAAFEFLATPFSALYRLIAGGEARNFANMLAHVEHDEGGQMGHSWLLTHIDFMGRFLRSVDPEQHQEESLEAGSEKKIFYAGKHRPYREWTDPNGRTYLKINIKERNWKWKSVTLGDPLLKIRKAQLYKYRGAEYLSRNENYKDRTVELYVEGEWKKFVLSSLEVVHKTFYEYDGKQCAFQNVDHKNHTVELDVDGDGKNWKKVCWRDPALEIEEGDKGQICYRYGGNLRRFKNRNNDNHTIALWVDAWDDVAIRNNEVVYGGEVRQLQRHRNSWAVQIGQNLQAIDDSEIAQTSNLPVTIYDSLTDEEKKPTVESAVQKAAGLFEEASYIGRAIHGSRNSGDKDQTDAVADELLRRVRNLKEGNRHMIIPFGQGEGEDYVTHFLIVEYIPAELNKPIPGGDGKPTIKKPSRLLFKHISFSSTTLGKQIQPMKTYEVKEEVKDDVGLKIFFRSLISIHPYSCSMDQLATSKKGPLFKDSSLERLLLEFANPIHTGAPKLSCSSRDPVKALFTILKELSLPETHLAQIDNVLPEMTSSKGKFFKCYVDWFIEYFEKNQHKLTPSEQGRALEGIAHYAEKVRHYWEKEIGVDGALAITDYLLSFLEKKLEGLKQTEELEKNDAKNLSSSVNHFRAVLADTIENEVTALTKVKDVESSRISIPELIAIQEISIELEIFTHARMLAGETNDANQEKANRESALKKVNQLLKKVEGYLNRNDPLAAKTLLLNLMEALPTPKSHDPNEPQQVWDKLDLNELDSWLSNLQKIGALMFEASARSGTFPLAPHEVFEFHVVLPLLLRYLFQLKIPKKVAEFNQSWANYLTDGGVKQKLTDRLAEFIKMREAQIEAEVTKRLKKEWEEKDEAYDKQWRDYRASQVAYGFAYTAYLAQQLNNPDAYEPPVPKRPLEIDVDQQKIERQRELAAAIVQAKEQDPFLRELKNTQAAPKENLSWNQIHGASDRFIAVIGSLAQVMGIPKELIGYNQTHLIQITGYGYVDNKDIWLMEHDCSVLIGGSPRSEKRYQGCKKAYGALNWHGNVPRRNPLISILIGYDRLGMDGTQFNEKTNEGRNAKEKLIGRFERHQKGFFNLGKGSNMLAPDELALCRLSVEYRKILGYPEEYLQPYASGILGNITNLFADATLTRREVIRKCAQMPRIFLVAAPISRVMEDGCFCLSSHPDIPTGVLSTTNRVEEEPPHFEERKDFFGQANAEQYGYTLGGDRERQAFLDSSTHPLFPSVNAAQDFLAKSTAMVKSGRKKNYSCLSVSECFKLITLEPTKLAVPSIRHTLRKTFLQHSLIRELILENPHFFILNGELLNKICQFFAAKDEEYRGCELFIREICQRIRRHTLDLERELWKVYGQKEGKKLVEKICRVLPEYSQKTVGDVCWTMMDKREQKDFATWALVFYCDLYEVKGIPFKEVTEWIKILNSFYIMQKSPIEVGHSGLQAELTYKVQTLLLPAIGKAIQEDATLRNKLLDGLSNKQGDWTPIPGKEYAYALQGQGPRFTIDLRTGTGFCIEIKRGNKCKLPEQIRAHDHYKLLFAEANPTVRSNEGDDGKVSYLWNDEERGRVIEFLYSIKNRQFQIFQYIGDKKYFFQKPTLNESTTTKLWEHLVVRRGNRTIEEFIKKKGIWVDLSEERSSGCFHALLAQHDQKINEDPIHLEIDGCKIVEASLGTGKDKKLICSGLSNRHNRLINCRDEHGLLLLSRGNQVDEIRFPHDPGSHEQLILKRSDADPSLWVVGGREEWQWVLSDTKDYEKSFGKDWRQYILILKNQTTEEEEIWIFPHMMTVPVKREEVKFLTSATDIFKYIGRNFNQNLADTGIEVPELLKKVDLEIVIAFIGVVESYFGGLGNVMEALEIFQKINEGDQSNAMMEQLIDLIKSISSPRGIRYQKGKRGERSTYSGFFYLSYIASRQGNWGAAIKYLELMTQCGYSTPEDAKQFQKMVLLTLGFEGAASTLNSTSLSNGIKSLFAPQSPKELAYRAKLAALLLGIRDHLKITQNLDLFDLSDQGVPMAGRLGMQQIVVAAGSNFYTQYRQLLPQHGREFRELGLLITPDEEKALNRDKTASAIGGVAGDIVLREINQRMPQKEPAKPIQPIHLEIPTDKDMTKMVKTMGGMVQQTCNWSIHDLHKKEGSYPKWTTVLANFWFYCDWILNQNVGGPDLAFLFQEIPPHSQYFEEINTARSLLILWRHYWKQPQGPLATHRKDHKITIEAMLASIRLKQLEVANLGDFRMKAERSQKEAAQSPSFTGLYQAIQDIRYAETRQQLSKLTYRDDQGDPRGSRLEFEQCSLDLLKILGDAITPYAKKEDRYLIKINGIEKDKPSIHIVPAEPIDPLKSQKAIVLGQLGLVFMDSPVGFIFLMADVNVQIKKALLKLVELPSYIAWDHLLHLLQNPEFGGNMLTPEQRNALPKYQANFERVLTTYQQNVGFPTNPYPKKLENGNYEEVKIRLPVGPSLDWEKYFTSSLLIWKHQKGKKPEECWESTHSIWDERAEIAIESYKKLQEKAGAENEGRLVHEFSKEIEGIKAAKKDLKKRTGSSFNASALKIVHKEIHFHLKTLHDEEQLGRKKILDFARSYADELGILYLFSDRYRFTQTQILNQIIKLYRQGQLGRLNHEKLQTYLAELITETILVATERQQYEHALGTCKTLSQILKRILDKLPRYIDPTHRKNMAQTHANRDVDWLLQSAELKRFLNEGSGRLRYAEKKADGLPIKYFLKDGQERCVGAADLVPEDEVYYKLRDQQFTRSYLVFEFGNGWITRVKAMKGLEKLLRDIKTSDREKAIPYIEVKMGTGKSDFIFPEVIHLLSKNKLRPVMITTDQLVPQLQESIGPCAFIFKFDINFGLTQKATPEQIQSHLQTLLDTLNQLESQGKAVLTATSQIAGLRDKRVQLQYELKKVNGSEQNTKFKQLQLIKQIEGYFNDPRVRIIIDEDAPYAIDFEHNYAIGDYETVDRIRFEVAEHLIYLIYHESEAFRKMMGEIYDDLDAWKEAGWTEAERNKIDKDEWINYLVKLPPNLAVSTPPWDLKIPDKQGKKEKLSQLIEGKWTPLCQKLHPYAQLWDLIVNNNLRAIQDVTKEFRFVAEGMYEDLNFWMNAGWTEEEWKQINRYEFIDYILGLKPDLPRSMPQWDPDKPDEQQKNMAFVAALKTFFSETLKSVHNVNPKLERGIAPNGITVIPYSDGSPKDDTLFGNVAEIILHHLLHYLGVCNKIAESVFDEKLKTLGALDLPVSLGQQTWKEWAGKIATEAIKMNCDTYTAFLRSPDLAIERFQLLRHLMLETPDVPVRIYREQIAYNCQDLSVPGRNIRVGSGTGNPYALNLADYTEKDDSVSTVWGETILCFDFNKPLDVMFENENPLDYIKRKAQDPDCQAFLNYDYKIKDKTEDIAAALRQDTGRQIIYRDHELAKKMWNPGEQYFPMPYEAGAIAPDAIFFYDPKDARGVHFHIPRGGKKYGMALFGISNKKNDIAQLLWRMRHLDNGHKLFLACDKKTEDHIRKVLGLSDNEPVTQGHAFIYFTGNSIEEKNLLNIKATIFKSQKPAKDYLDAVVGKPYDMKGNPDPTTLADFEGQIIFPTVQALYISNNYIQWIKEYQPQKKVPATKFVEELYAAEKKKIKQMKQLFYKLYSDWIEMNPSVKALIDENGSFMWVQQQLLIHRKNPSYQFEESLTLHLKQMGRQAEGQPLLREILRKIYAIQSAFIEVKKEIKREEERIKEDKAYKKFIENNLPMKIASDPTGGSHAEQKIQQQQQTNEQTKQQQVEKVYTPVQPVGHTNPMDPFHFKKVALGIERIKFKRKGKQNYFSLNGNFLPLPWVLASFKGIEFPEKLRHQFYRNAYISERAWALLQCMGQNGVPAFDLFVIQRKDGTNCTVITTPAEREQTITPWMLAERERKNPFAPPPSPYPDDVLWEDLRVAIGLAINRIATDLGMVPLADFFRGRLLDNLENQKNRYLLFVKDSLSQSNGEEAWNTFSQQVIQPLLNAQELNAFRDRINSGIGPLKFLFLKMQKKFQKAHANFSIDQKINSDCAIVVALSSEIFSQPLILDGISVPDENRHFILMIALNKIYLNWPKFTLLELDLLIPVICNLDLDELTGFVLQLEEDHSQEMADFLRRMYFKNTETGRKCREEIVIRKLEENHIMRVNALRDKGIDHPEPFSAEEEKILEAWITKQGNTIMAAKIDLWKRKHPIEAGMDPEQLKNKENIDPEQLKRVYATINFVLTKQAELKERAGIKTTKT